MSSAVAGWFVAALSLAHYLLSLSLPLALNPSHLLRLHFYLPSSVMGQICSSLSPDLGAPQTRISSQRCPFLGWGACLLRGRQLHSRHWRFKYAASYARRPSGDGRFRWFGPQNHRACTHFFNLHIVSIVIIASLDDYLDQPHVGVINYSIKARASA